MDIVAGLSIAKSALDIVKAVREALKQKKLTSEQILEQLVALQDRLVDVNTALADADDENRRLKREIEDLKAQLQRRQFLRENYEFRDNMVWNRGAREGPYCPVCFEADDKLVHLQDLGDQCYDCTIHRQTFCPPHAYGRGDFTPPDYSQL